MSKSVKIVAAAAVLAGALAAAGWWYAGGPVRVEVTAPIRGPAVEAVYATGTVEPVRWTKIASTVTGRIVEYPAIEGWRVKAGNLLVRLDDRKARATLEELEARIEFLEKDQARYKALVQQSTVSRQAYERVTSELDRAKALARVARQKLADLAILAPFDGEILRKDGELGDVVQAGDVLLWVGTERPYWITADVDEEDIPRVEPRQRALIKADAFPDRVLEGEVSEITPKGDPVDKQYRVRILLPAASPLMIGMTTEVNVVLRAEENALLISERALRDGVVWLARDGKAVPRPVAVGAYGEGLVEIRDGLSEDDRVILDPPADLESGAALKVR